MKSTAVTFPSRDGLNLEGLLYYFGDGERRPAAVVCHPHPLFGGTMRSVLVARIARTLAQHGFVVLRFNFRGVGNSEGVYDEGRGEQQDVAGALDALLAREDVDPTRAYLTGWSFGAWIGLVYGVRDERVAGFGLVGIPLDRVENEPLPPDPRPKLFLTGEYDEFCPPERLRRWAARLAGPVWVEVLEKTDHFLAGRQQEGADLIARYLSRWAGIVHEEDNPWRVEGRKEEKG